MIRYGTRFGCRFSQPHDMVILKDSKAAMMEKCRICQKRFKWVKGYKGRLDNVEYLKAHLRAYAQPNGPTKRIFMKLYHPELCIIKI